MAQERLQKLLAQAGVASRRAAEELITAGRVRVNGRIVRELGSRADLYHDRVEVDGKRLVAEKPAYYLLNKPRGMVTTLNDPEGRESLGTVLERVPERVFPVGRLDYHTSGALLVTNDGEMADALLHPTQGVPKTYVAKLKGSVDEKDLAALRNGVVLDDGYKTDKAEVFVLREDRGNSWLSITIREGKNRQIHRMGDAIGHRVMRLSRSVFAGLGIEGLRPGTLRPLTTREVDKLKKEYLNPKRRRRANESRQRAAVDNAELFEGWGHEVVSEPPTTGPRSNGASSGGRASRRSGATQRSPRVNPTAERAVRALSESRRAAPASRSIGGGRDDEQARSPGRPAKKAAAKKTSAKRASASRASAGTAPASRAPAKKASTKRAPASRAPAKKTAAKKTAANETAGRKPASKRGRGARSSAKPGSGKAAAKTRGSADKGAAARGGRGRRAEQSEQSSGRNERSGKTRKR